MSEWTRLGNSSSEPLNKKDKRKAFYSTMRIHRMKNEKPKKIFKTV